MASKITYSRVHPGDPDTVEWNGRSFTHGEAVEFDGRTNEGKAFVEAARGNPWFAVDGENGDDDTGGTKAPKKKDVDSPETYRVYALDWINRVKPRSNPREPSAAFAMQKRWDDEAELRDAVGWGSDDQGNLDPILRPKLELLKKSED